MTNTPAGSPPFKAHRRAYRELMQKLWYANELFRNEGDGGLEGAKTACLAIKDYIAVRHENPELAAPFISIAQAFEDLERGITPEIFSTDVRPKKRPRSSEHRRLQIFAAALLDVSMVVENSAPASRNRDQVASWIADSVRRWPGMTRVDAVTVINWRDQMHKKPWHEQQQFDAIRSHLLGLSNPRLKVEEILKYPPGAAKT